MAGPKYRIFIAPERLDKALIDTRSLAVKEILLSPPNLRPDCFGFRGLSKTRLTPEGIEGIGITAEQELTLTKNGYLELRCPLRSALFQWYKEEAGVPDVNWLYPYAVLEMPLSILKVAKALYEIANIRTNIRLGQEYRNVAGFALPYGHPRSPFFGRKLKAFEGQHIVSREIVLNSDYEPRRVARVLVEEVYTHFGYKENEVPQLEDAVDRELQDGGRRYWYDVLGRSGWSVNYVKEVDKKEKTVRFYQEIYDQNGQLVEVHQKYPEDTGHQLVEK